MSRFSSPPSSPLGVSRTTLIVGGVVLFHAAALWALQSGLIRKAAEVIVPVEILAQIIEPPRPAPPPPPPAPPQKQAPKPPPRPIAIREPKPVPAPNAPTGVVEPPPVTAPAPMPPAPPAPAAPVAPPAPVAPVAPPAPRLVEVTQGQTTYVREPRAIYPTMSRKLGETGTVVVAVYFNADGMAKRAEIAKSSGYERLDQAALSAAMTAQVTPFRQLGGGDAQTVYLLRAPFNFVLN